MSIVTLSYVGVAAGKKHVSNHRHPALYHLCLRGIVSFRSKKGDSMEDEDTARLVVVLFCSRFGEREDCW